MHVCIFGNNTYAFCQTSSHIALVDTAYLHIYMGRCPTTNDTYFYYYTREFSVACAYTVSTYMYA